MTVVAVLVFATSAIAAAENGPVWPTIGAAGWKLSK